MAREITNNELFELVTKMYSEMTGMRSEMNGRMDKLEGDIKELKDDVTKINVKLESIIEPKISALFDGYVQNTEMLNRIEKQVVKHDEVILHRIK